MHNTVLAAVSAGLLVVAAGQSDAMPLQSAPAPAQSQLIEMVAGGCGPGLVRGRSGACVVRRTVFSPHGHRIITPGCGKRIGAQGLRTPC